LRRGKKAFHWPIIAEEIFFSVSLKSCKSSESSHHPPPPVKTWIDSGRLEVPRQRHGARISERPTNRLAEVGAQLQAKATDEVRSVSSYVARLIVGDVARK
jgi:hypothetical protein